MALKTGFLREVVGKFASLPNSEFDFRICDDGLEGGDSDAFWRRWSRGLRNSLRFMPFVHCGSEKIRKWEGETEKG
jgi:hypothetical protein